MRVRLRGQELRERAEAVRVVESLQKRRFLYGSSWIVQVRLPPRLQRTGLREM